MILRKIIRPIIIGVIALVPLAYCTLPEIYTIVQAESPDGYSVAVVSERVYSSIFSAPEVFITIRPSGWLHKYQGDAVLGIAESASLKPRIEWRNDHELVVHIMGMTHTDEIYLQVPEYRGIKISYDFQK